MKDLSQNKYGLGCVRNPKDLRDVQLAQVQAPVSLPEKHITDISMIPVFNQLANGSCVGHAHATAQIYYEMKENGKLKNLSPRYLYALSKKLDGAPIQQGTWPRITAGVMFKNGCATELAIPNNTNLSHENYIQIPENEEIIADAKPYKIKGYAEVASNKDALKQAIFQNGVIAITISVGNFSNPILPGNLGLHRVLAYGFDKDRIFYRNSWGKNWGDQGNGYFDWGTQQVTDILAFVDLPNAIIEEARKKNNPQYIIVHHEAPPVIVMGDRFEIVDKYHKSLGWGKIGYHYFIEKSGAVRQGRQDNEEGAHTVGRNGQSLGICLAGNFDLEMPTKAQIEALKSLIQQKMTQYSITAINIVPHRFFATQTLQGKSFIKNDTPWKTWDGCKPTKSCYGSKLNDEWARNLTVIEEMVKIDVPKSKLERVLAYIKSI